MVGLSICIHVSSFMRNVIIVVLFIKNKTIVIFLFFPTLVGKNNFKKKIKRKLLKLLINPY